MMTQRTGALIFDETADRYDIRFDVNDYYGGLHCGDCIEVFVRGKWKPTRMEYGDNWYLVGIRARQTFPGCGYVFNRRRENGRFFHARQRRAYHHRTRKEETHCRRKPTKRP